MSNITIKCRPYVCKFKYDRLHINKALGNFRKSDNNSKNKKDVRSALRPSPGPEEFFHWQSEDETSSEMTGSR